MTSDPLRRHLWRMHNGKRPHKPKWIFPTLAALLASQRIAALFGKRLAARPGAQP